MRQPIFVIPLLVLFCMGDASGANKKIVSPPGAKPGGNYSQGILTGDTLYISGQGGEDASGKISSDFDAEVRQYLENIGAVLKDSGNVAGRCRERAGVYNRRRQIPTNECRLHELLQRSEADENDSSSRGTVGAGEH